jgi:hypothetical protein
MPHTTETPKQYQCRHIFTDGHRCSSPCLRQQEFCYYHHTTRKPIANPGRRRSRSSTFHLPLPEDRSAIQSSIGEVLQRIAANEIDPRRAGLLLYGLQIASLNLPKTQPATHHNRNSATQRNQNSEPVETVEEIIIDPELGILAPRTEVGQATQRKSAVQLLIEKMMRSDEEEKAAAAEAAAQEPTVLPNLQATESRPPQTQHTWPPRQRDDSTRKQAHFVMQSKSRTGVESSTFLLAQTRSGVDTAFSRCPSGALQTPCLPAFGYHDIPVLSRFEYLVQIGSLRLGSHERGILFTRHIEVAIHIAAAAELDLKLSPSRQVSDRSYAG